MEACEAMVDAALSDILLMADHASNAYSNCACVQLGASASKHISAKCHHKLQQACMEV